jgi:HlyD family secretion protein
MAGIFRQTALNRLEAPEQTDQILRVTSLRAWVALLAMGLLLAAAVFWGFYGSVPTTVRGTGMLMRSSGIFTILAPGVGQIADLHVRPNDPVTTGQLVGRISQNDAIRDLEAALSKVEEIRQRLLATQATQGSQTALLEASARQQRTHLTAANRMIEIELKRLEERLAGEKKLAAEGLITGQQLLTTNQQIHQSRNNRAKNLEQLANLDISLAESRATQKATLADLTFQIAEAERTVSAMRLRLQESTRIISPYTGRIVDVLAKPHDQVTTGAPTALVELTGQDIKDLEGVFFVAPDVGKRLSPGMEAFLAPTIVKPEKYGYIRAIITWVSPYPVSSKEVNDIFHNEATTQLMMVGGAPFQVHADLIPDAKTPSGYRWTSSEGPPLRLHSGTMSTIEVTVEEEPPISLVLPFLKSLLFGT